MAGFRFQLWNQNAQNTIIPPIIKTIRKPSIAAGHVQLQPNNYQFT